MKKYTLKKILLIALALIQTSMSFAQSEAYLNLGNCKFIPSNKNIAFEDRILKKSMASFQKNKGAGIPNIFTNEIGGVAFAETAQPADTLKVQTFSLECDNTENKAYAIINGVRYDIPLDVWQLQPIVEYANSKYNAAVTIYGKRIDNKKASVLFHEAFIDKLLGLRLLQVDLLLAGNYISSTDALCGLPEYEKGEPILGYPNEKYNVSSCLNGIVARSAIWQKMLLLGDSSDYDSYIYTDYGQQIVFGINNGQLTITGKPYYRFTRRSDELTYRKFIKKFNSYWIPMKKNWRPINGQIADWFPTMAKVDSLNRERISESEKMKKLSRILPSYYLRCNDEVLKTHINTLKEINNLEESTHRKKLYENNMRAYHFCLDETLIMHCWEEIGGYQNILLKELTDWLKENDTFVDDLNPTVVEAAQNTCQWSAFFRWAKKNYGKNWAIFVKQVRQLNDFTPKVYTPVEIINEKNNE